MSKKDPIAGVDFFPWYGMKVNRKEQEELQREDYAYQASEAWQGKKAVTYSGKQVILANYILEKFPNWQRKNQGIGDCVSFGHEACATILMCIEDIENGQLCEAEAATETIYGQARVEVWGKSHASWNDGASASGGSKALVEYGIIPRLNFSNQTGESFDDYRKYSGDKAKNFGYYGSGNHSGDGGIDTIARKTPVTSSVFIETIEQAATCLENGYPLAVCSSLGFNMTRDSNGIGHRSGSWNHCMALVGIRTFNGELQPMLMQSWGASCKESAPFPGVNHKALKRCCWWVKQKDFKSLIAARGTYAFSNVKGLKKRRLKLADIYDF
jgi:hypothetical protein